MAPIVSFAAAEDNTHWNCSAEARGIGLEGYKLAIDALKADCFRCLCIYYQVNVIFSAYCYWKSKGIEI
jgi:hypothetical protein